MLIWNESKLIKLHRFYLVGSKIKLICECVPWHGRTYMRFFYWFYFRIDKIN